MKTILIISTLIMHVIGASITKDAEATVLNNNNTNDGKGNYKFSFETSNGIFRREVGTLVNIGEPDEHIEVYGKFSYNDPDGNTVVVLYAADRDGYQTIEPFLETDDKMGPHGHVVATLLGK